MTIVDTGHQRECDLRLAVPDSKGTAAHLITAPRAWFLTATDKLEIHV